MSWNVHKIKSRPIRRVVIAAVAGFTIAVVFVGLMLIGLFRGIVTGFGSGIEDGIEESRDLIKHAREAWK